MKAKHVGIADLKAHLSAHLQDVRKGHSLVVVDRGHPVAKLMPIQAGDNALQVREPSRPFAEFSFARQGRGLTDSVAVLLEDRSDRG